MKKTHLICITILLVGITEVSAQCRNLCTITITNAKTKQKHNGDYMVEVKTGWTLWTESRQDYFKTKEHLTTIFAIVHTPSGPQVLKAHKGTGPSLVWSGSSPSVNCDVFPWGSFNVVDMEGSKGTIKLKTYK